MLYLNECAFSLQSQLSDSYFTCSAYGKRFCSVYPKGCVLQCVLLDALSDVTVVLGMRQSIVSLVTLVWLSLTLPNLSTSNKRACLLAHARSDFDDVINQIHLLRAYCTQSWLAPGGLYLRFWPLPSSLKHLHRIRVILHYYHSCSLRWWWWFG